MRATANQIDCVALRICDTHVELAMSLHKLEIGGGDEMAVNVGDHGSKTEVSDLEPIVIEEIVSRSLHHNASVFEYIAAIRDAQDVVHALLDDQNGVVLIPEI